MISSLFVVGGIWFWLLTLLAAGALLIAVEKEHGVGATICFAVYFAAIHLFGDATLLQKFGNHWEWVLAAAALYFILGAGWSLVKWFLWNKQKAVTCLDNYQVVRQRFLQDKLGVGPTKATITEKTAVPEDLREEWTQHIEERHNRNSGYRNDDGVCVDIYFTVPRAQQHKSRIIMWMSFWPASAAFSLTRDPIKNLCTGIYNHLAEKYQELAEKAWRSAVAEREVDITQPETLAEDPAGGPVDKPNFPVDSKDADESDAVSPGDDSESKGLWDTVKDKAGFSDA